MGRQGQFVEVYDDRVVVERREFCWGESLGPDRIIPWPPVRKPFEPKALEKATPAPAFAALREWVRHEKYGCVQDSGSLKS